MWSQPGWYQNYVSKVNAIDNDTKWFTFIGKKNVDILLGKKKCVTICESLGNQNWDKYQAPQFCNNHTATNQTVITVMNGKKLDNIIARNPKKSDHIAQNYHKKFKKLWDTP